MKVIYRDQTLEFDPDEDETIAQFAVRLAAHISADVARITLLFMPKPGLLKSPFPERLLSEVITEKTRIKLVGAPDAEVKKLDDMGAQVPARQIPSSGANRVPKVQASKYRDWRKAQDEAQYTFHVIEPLPYLPNPEKSRRFLERLANDPGIKASMRKHKFSVGLLTEMNPIEHTSSTYEGVSRTLGLNRNRGEVIELRLRTDAYDGYRDYKVIRKTLCHELSHNVWGDHDRNFWNLTKEIEQEVERNDTLHGGRRLTDAEFYNPDDSFDPAQHTDDHGGWTGGDFVLGRSKDASTQNDAGLSRREIMAKAATSRIQQAEQVKKQNQSERDKETPDGPS
ncbi:hypothetical protein DV736_g1574, partial [Chaetothyriales sp. CBS 134916]